MFTTSPHISIRSATAADTRAIWRLAALDCRRAPAGDVLLAESDGRLVAAVAVAGGPAVADPFQFTAEAVAMLELRREQLHTAAMSGLRLQPSGGLLPASQL